MTKGKSFPAGGDFFGSYEGFTGKSGENGGGCLYQMSDLHGVGHNFCLAGQNRNPRVPWVRGL